MTILVPLLNWIQDARDYADPGWTISMEALMAVRRIVPNIASDQLDKAKSFYAEVLDMEVAMDLGWIVTFAAASNANPAD